MRVKDDENFAAAMNAFYQKRGYSDLEKVRDALEAYLPNAIAEAVAAEREKNLASVERARIASDGWGDPIDDGDCERNEGIDLALEAIRSAAK